MKSCGTCGTTNPPEARFCLSCGSRLPELCPRCEATLPDLARFCPACGASVAPEEPSRERRLVTVLFADVVGSTGLGERLDPERLRSVMERYFRAMRAEIEAEGGTVEKFIGDAIVAVFGVPQTHEDDGARALQAAIRMRGRLEALNEELLASYGLSLGLRMGVNSGEVIAVRGHRPEEGMVMGDAVNVAARLEQHAEPGQVLVSGRTARSVRGFDLREIGPLSLKGKDRTVPAFVLAGRISAPSRGIPGVEVPMVGREAELGLLRSLYERTVLERRPHLVTIYGEAGLGKSRLVGEFESWARTAGGAVELVRGPCLPYGEGVTYWPLAEILKQRADVLDSDPPERALAKIRSAVGEVLGDLRVDDPAHVVAALAYTVGLEDPEVPLGGLEPRRVRFEMHGAWRTFFSALGARGPAVVVVEDVHWADPALLDLLEDLGNRVEGPVMFLCPARPELTERRPGWGGGRRSFSGLFLEPLSAAEAERLMGLLLSPDDLSPQARQTVLGRAEGNPFFLEEIVRQLIDEGKVERTDGGLPRTAELEGVDIPDTVQAVLAARIDLLDPADRRALQAAAVVGRVFWTGPVRQLLNGEVASLDEILGRLEDRELVRARLSSTIEGEREYAFKHVLTRDVSYETLTRRDRARAHASVAEWLEDTAGDRSVEFAELLAHHYEEAYRGVREDPGADRSTVEDLRARALRFLLLASDESRSRLVLDKAARFAERAMSHAAGELERSLVLEALGEAYLFDYWGDRAWEHLRAAVDARLASAPDDRAAIAKLCARALESPTRWGAMRRLPDEREARRYLEIGLAHAGDGDSEERTRLLVLRSLWPAAYHDEATTDEEIEEGRRVGEEAAAMALRLGRADLASAALDGVGYSYLVRGHAGRLQDVTRRRLELLPVVQDPREIEDTFAMAALAAFHAGRYEDAERYASEGFQRSLSVTEAMGLHCLEWRALARFRLGDWDGFFRDVAEAGDLVGSRTESPPGFISRPFAVAALIHEIRGERSEADRLLARLESLEEWQEPGTFDAWVGLLLARRGLVKECRQRLERPEFAYLHDNLGLILEARCDALAEEEAWDDAAATAAEARRHAEEGGLEALSLHADRLEGRAAAALGDPGRARELLERAAQGFAALGARWEAACTELSLALALEQAGTGDAARRVVQPAVGEFERVGSLRELARARRILESA